MKVSLIIGLLLAVALAGANWGSGNHFGQVVQANIFGDAVNHSKLQTSGW
jgi:hypothetical protein